MASSRDDPEGVVMGRMLSIHAVVFALLVAGCSSRRSELTDRSRWRHRHQASSEGKEKREEEAVARAEKTGEEEQQEEPAAKKKEDWPCTVKRECRKALKGVGKFGYDVTMAAVIGVTVGLVIAVVFVAGAS
jgi:Flp pilus assembly protein TadB